MRRAAFFSASDEKGYYIVLVGRGEMFDGGFLAVCGRYIQKHDGTRLSELKRTQELIRKADIQQQKELKQERDRVRKLFKRRASAKK